MPCSIPRRGPLPAAVVAGLVAIGLAAASTAATPVAEPTAIVEIGLISKRSFCRGSVLVIERRLEALMKGSSRLRPLRVRSSRAPEPDAVDSARIGIQGLLDDEHVWLVVIQADGTPLLVVRVPDVPRAQLRLWERVEAILEP